MMSTILRSVLISLILLLIVVTTCFKVAYASCEGKTGLEWIACEITQGLKWIGAQVDKILTECGDFTLWNIPIGQYVPICGSYVICKRDGLLSWQCWLSAGTDALMLPELKAVIIGGKVAATAIGKIFVVALIREGSEHGLEELAKVIADTLAHEDIQAAIRVEGREIVIEIAGREIRLSENLIKVFKGETKLTPDKIILNWEHIVTRGHNLDLARAFGIEPTEESVKEFLLREINSGIDKVFIEKRTGNILLVKYHGNKALLIVCEPRGDILRIITAYPIDAERIQRWVKSGRIIDLNIK